MSGTARSRVAGAVAAVVAAVAVVVPMTPGAASAAAGPVEAAAGTGAFTEAPCAVPLPDWVQQGRDVRCGSVSVPLRHDRPDAGDIQIAVAVLPPSSGSDAGTSLLLLGGGPGDHFVVSALPGVLPGPDGTRLLAPDRTLVLLDQRGAGLSRPALECPEVTAVGTLDVPAAEGTRRVVEAYASCRDRLVAEGNDLSAYTTRNNALDLDVVRQALGLSEVDVLGTSYGTRLALTAARSADWIRSLTLNSPAPTTLNYVERLPRSFEEGWRRFLRACRTDPACAPAASDVQRDLDAVLSQLSASPQLVSVPVGDTEVQVLLDAPKVAGVVFDLLFDAAGPSPLPGLVREWAAGRYESAAQLTVESSSGPDLTSEGMQLSIRCAEDGAYANPGRMLRNAAAAGPLFRAFLDEPGVATGAGPVGAEVCADWGVDREPRNIFRAVRTPIPTLVVTGQLDPITPVSFARSLERQLPVSSVVVAAGIGHAPLNGLGLCGLEVLRDFLDDPSRAPGTACVPATARVERTGPIGPTGVAS